MRRKRWVATAWVAVLVLLAGCAAPGDEGLRAEDLADPTDPVAPAAPAPRAEVEIRADLPVWRVGQGWRHVVDVPGVRTHTVTMMVAEEHADLFLVATDDPQFALHHAIYPTTPVLGRNGKETLAPFQAGSPVRMYEFPLTDGKRWSAEFFGETMQFSAQYAGDIALSPRLGLGDFAEGFRVTATGGSGTRVLYDYVEAAEWFTRFEVIDPDGARLIRLDLVGILPDYRGPYHFLRGEHLLVETITATPLEPAFVEFEVPPAERFHDGLAIGVRYVGNPGLVPAMLNLTVLGPPDDILGDAVYYERAFSGLGQSFARVDLAVPPACIDPDDGSCSGTFRVRVIFVGDGEVEVRLVSYQRFAEGSL